MSAETTAAAMEPSTKRLRSGGEPDLKVWVGGEQQSGNGTVFHHHSLLLAAHSEYVDTMLATPMAERESRSLNFPDIEPPVWEKMLALLEDPIESRQMNVDDALQVFPFYDKYQFMKGIKLCDHVFHEFVLDFNGKDIPAASLDTVIDVSVMADRVNTGKAKQVCLQHLQGVVSRSWLSEEQINKLIPLITKEQILLDAIGMTKEEVQSPLLHRFWQTRHQLRDLSETLNTLVLTGGRFCDIHCRKQTGNSYISDSENVSSHFLREYVRISVERGEAENWCVCFVQRNGAKNAVWICPHSKHLDVPPCEGWDVVGDSNYAGGSFGPLEIEYRP